MGEWVYDPVSGGTFYVPDPGEVTPPGATGGGGGTSGSEPSPSGGGGNSGGDRPDFTQGPAPEPAPTTIGATPSPEGGPEDQPAPITSGEDTGARVGVSYGDGYTPSPNAPPPASYVPPKLTIKDYDISDSTTYENRVYKYNMIVRDYESRASDFNSRWDSKIRDGQFVGTEAEYKRYLREFADLQSRADRIDNVHSRLSESAAHEADLLAKERAKQARALDFLKKYKEGDGYNIAAAIKDGHLEAVRDAGFAASDIQAAMAAPVALSGKAAFDQLVREGKIPQNSRYDHTDADGNLVYFPPFAGLEDAKKEFDKLDDRTKMRYVSQTLKPPVLYSDQMTRQDTSFFPKSYDSLSQADKEKVLTQYRLAKALDQSNKDMAIGLIPLVGTIYTWKRTSTPWRAVNIATDVLTFVPVGRVTRLLKGTAGQVDDMVRAGRSVERATLKATAPKEVVKAYDGYVKAVDEFARNKAFIKTAERDIARGIRPEAVDMGPKLRTLQQAKEIDAQLAFRAKQAGDAFAKVQQGARAKGTIIGKAAVEDAALSDFGSRSVANVKAVIDSAFAGKIAKPATIERQIRATQKALMFAEHDRDIPRLRELTQRMVDLNSKLKISKSGEFRQLYEEYTDLAERIASGKLKPRELKQLKLERLRIEKKIAESMKYQEDIWKQPFSKGRGGRGRELKPRDFGPGGGGKKTNEWNYAVRTREEATEEAIRERDLLRRLDDYLEYERNPHLPIVWPKESLLVRAAVVAPARPRTVPVTIPQPETEPAPEPDRGPKRVPRPSPVTRPSPAPETVGTPATEPETKAKPREGTSPSPTPRPQPAPSPQPSPQPQPRPQPTPVPTPKPGPQPQPSPTPAPTPTPTITTVPTPTGVPVRPRRFIGMSDTEKRRVIADADTKAAWVQGRLHGKPVIHVLFGRAGQYAHVTVLGTVPEGVTMARGKGSAYRSITLTRGVPPTRPVQLEGGAIDPVVSPLTDRKGVKIDFVRDPKVTRHGNVTVREIRERERKPKEKPRFSIHRRAARASRGIDLGGDIVRDRRGQHLRL